MFPFWYLAFPIILYLSYFHIPFEQIKLGISGPLEKMAVPAIEGKTIDAPIGTNQMQPYYMEKLFKLLAKCERKLNTEMALYEQNEKPQDLNGKKEDRGLLAVEKAEKVKKGPYSKKSKIIIGVFAIGIALLIMFTLIENDKINRKAQLDPEKFNGPRLDIKDILEISSSLDNVQAILEELINLCKPSGNSSKLILIVGLSAESIAYITSTKKLGKNQNRVNSAEREKVLSELKEIIGQMQTDHAQIDNVNPEDSMSQKPLGNR